MRLYAFSFFIKKIFVFFCFFLFFFYTLITLSHRHHIIVTCQIFTPRRQTSTDLQRLLHRQTS
jgi:hypothetical protein